MVNQTHVKLSEAVLCPDCGSDKLLEQSIDQQFSYGAEGKEVVLTAVMPVTTCQDCGYQTFDERGEVARHLAICKHLGVLTPTEISEVRHASCLSRSEFSDIGGFGIASLQRWESGSLIPNLANDRLIYLLQFRENIARLRSREIERTRSKVTDSTPLLIDNSETTDTIPGHRRRRFRRFVDSGRIEKAALQFRLRS